MVEAPLAPRIHEPTLIGDVTLKTRNMFKKRSGRPRSETSSAGLTASPAMLMYSAAFASGRLPVARAARPRIDEAPASPPVKRYHGISGCQTGSFRIGRP